MSHDELEYSQVGQLQLFYSLDLFCSPQQHLSCCSSLGCQLGLCSLVVAQFEWYRDT